MAKGKGGDLRDQLGSFLKGALSQLDSVREVVVQKANAGRIQLDVAMMRRRRREVLADLGEVAARLAVEGKLSEDDFPEIGPALAQLEALDEKIAAEEDRARRVGGGTEQAGAAGPPHEEFYDEEEDEEHEAADAAPAPVAEGEEPHAAGAPAKDDEEPGSG
jgi:hypothetical protein